MNTHASLIQSINNLFIYIQVIEFGTDGKTIYKELVQELNLTLIVSIGVQQIALFDWTKEVGQAKSRSWQIYLYKI